MFLRYSDEQVLIQDAARGLLGKFGTPEARRAADISEEGYDSGLWQALLEMGWLEAADGAPENFETLAVLSEELGRYAVATPLLRVTAVLLLLAASGQPSAQKLREEIVSGRTLVVGAANAAKGRREGGAIHLELPSHLVEFANVAARFVVLADLDDGSRAVCVIDRNAPGVTIEAAELVDNIPGAWLGISGAVCSGEDILAETISDAAFTAWSTQVQLLQAAEATASAQGALDLTLGYVKERAQFGRAIGSFQAIQHGLADVKAAIDAAWLVVWEGVAGVAVGEAPADGGAMAAWLALRALERAAIAGSQYHGGMGMVVEYPMQYYYRRSAASPSRMGGEWDLLGRTADVYIDNSFDGKKSAFELQ